MVMGPSSLPRSALGVDDLELRHRGADFEAVVVDRQRDQAGFEAPGAHAVRELAGVLADDADGDLWVAAREVFDEAGQQQVVGGAERPERRGPAGEGACSPHGVGGVGCGRERTLGLGPEQPPGVGELEPAAGAHEERDAELGFEVGDLLGDAGAREVQGVRGGGEGAVLGRGEEVRELLERHCRRQCLRQA